MTADERALLRDLREFQRRQMEHLRTLAVRHGFHATGELCSKALDLMEREREEAY